MEGGGNVGVGVALGEIHNYRRVDSELSEDTDDVSSHDRQEQKVESSRTRKYVIACAVFASLNNVLVGYDVGVMSGAAIFIREDLGITEVQEEVLIGCLSFVSLFGSLVGGRMSDAIGRKWTMALAAVIFQIGAIIMTIARSFQLLMIGRLLAGIGIGLGVMIAPVYIAEISPTVDRGFLTSFTDISINIGILLGYISNFAFASLPVKIGWRIMLAVGIFPSIFVAFALFVIPESPRWLVMQNHIEKARLVLLQTIWSEREVEERLEEIQSAAGLSSAEKYEERAVWQEILCPIPKLRRILVAGVGIQCFQQLTGIDATIYYSPEIFKEAGIRENSKLFAATVAIGVTKTVCIVLAMFLIDKHGRKPLLFVSTIGMTFCLFGLGTTLILARDGSVWIAPAIIFACANVAFFSVGMGPVCWVLTSEIFPLRLRAQAVALVAVGNRVCSGLVSMSFLTISHAIYVGGTFLVFSAISAASVVFVYTLVPETKETSLEKIELLFQNEHEGQNSGLELDDVEYLMKKE